MSLPPNAPTTERCSPSRVSISLRSAFAAWPAWLGAVAVGAFALALRLVDLSGTPSGMHGDEAIVGLEAERVLRDGWIGLYSPHAAGQPAGPLYVFAPFVWLFGNTIFGVRLLTALVGALTAVLLFLVLRRRLGLAGALVAAFLLAGMVWHLHYSRIAFPIIFWPLSVLMAQWALVRAFETRDWRWWAVAGGLVAAGVYVYNAHWMFGAAVALTGLLYLAIRYADFHRRDFVNVAGAGVCAAVVLLPIFYFLADGDHTYTRHFERDALVGSDEWQAADGLSERASLLAGRYADVWRILVGTGEPDRVDAGGVIALVSVPLLLLALHGLAIGWRRPAARWWWLISVAFIAVMPLASVFTLDGVPRRPFAMALNLAVLAGIGAMDVEFRLRSLLHHKSIATRPLAPAAAFLAVLLSLPGIHAYFTSFANDSFQRWVFLEDFTDAALYMRELRLDASVVVASPRHSVDYATREFLAPEVHGQDWEGESWQLRRDAVGDNVVVVLIGREQALKPMVLGLGGDVLVTSEQTGHQFTAICLRCSSSTLRELRQLAHP